MIPLPTTQTSIPSPQPQQTFSPSPRNKRTTKWRSVRPSLLDVRFTGDPWVASEEDGFASLCLDDYCLARIDVLSVDVSSMYHSLLRMREVQGRQRLRIRFRRTVD